MKCVYEEMEHKKHKNISVLSLYESRSFILRVFEELGSIFRIKGLGCPPTKGLLFVIWDQLANRGQDFLIGIFVQLVLNSLLYLHVVRLVEANCFLGLGRLRIFTFIRGAQITFFVLALIEST